MAKPPSNRESERTVALGDDDKRKLYGLLDADVPARLRRIELGIVALFVLSGGSRAAELATGTDPTGVLIGWLF